MFHEYSHNNIDQHELRHEHKDDKEDGSNTRMDTAVAYTICLVITVVSQGVLK